MQNFEVSFIAFVIVSSILIVGSAGLHEESTPDYYKTLGLSEDCAQDDVKKAFRRLAMKYHPDKCKEPDAEKKFQEIGEAYEILSDPDKRQEYDNRRKFGGSYQPHTSFNFQNFNFDDLFAEFDDFENFQGPHASFGGNRFNVFSDFPDFSNLNFGSREKTDSHRFGGGSSFFGQHFGGGGGDIYRQRSSQSGSRCKTVTQKVGNTITTYTTCT
ncbi:hypothetical protein V9T40_001316 [Parthenolecanium corni]|uniref:DnaJ homolog subfamily B member 9 n=1 Tax=Parthenolecanium corni TaxID=536013 RepID=A0AAN9TP10_9HEMI